MINKKKNKAKIFKIAAIAVCGALVAGFSAGVSQTSYADGVWSEISLESEYERGKELAIPARQVIVGGKTIEANAVLKKPDGSAISKSSVILDAAGDYTLQYTAGNGGEVYFDEVKFSVYAPLASVSSSASKAEYQTVKKEFPTNGGKSDFEKSGLYVRLAQNDTLTIEQVIDVSSLTKEDTLIALSVIPDTIGECDFETFHIRLADAADPATYLSIDLNGYPGDGAIYPYSYLRAGGENQTRRGYEAGKNTVHIENKWGGGVTHSFYGTYTNPYGAEYNDPDLNQTVKIRYDAAETAVYGTTGGLVIDMNDAKFFDEFWNGFKSDKAKLTISCADYTKSSANFLLSEVCGVDLTQSRLTEKDEPIITVHADENNIPSAKIGLPYRLFGADAFGYYSGRLNVTARVYYDYNFPGKAVNVSVVNGAFTPEKAGYYAIEYTATAYDGTSAKKVIWVYAGDISAPHAVSSFAETRVEAGTLIDLTSSYAVEGGAGGETVRIEARCGDIKIDCTNEPFRPEKTGAWQIIYTVTDYAGQTGTTILDFEVYAGEKPLFLSEAAVPEAMLAGSTYTLPKLYASDYSSGSLRRVECLPKVYDKNNPDGKTLADGEKYAAAAEKNGDTVKIVYAAGNAEKAYEIPVAFPFDENGSLKIGNYFIGSDISAEVTATASVISATGENGRFTFANALTAQNLTLALRTLSDSKKYGGIKITLTDAADGENAICAYLLDAGGKTRFETSDGSILVAAGFSDIDKSNGLTLKYADGKFTLGTAALGVSKTTTGKPFGGFTSDKAWLNVSFIDASRGAKFEMLSINSQTLINTKRDRIAPDIVLFGEYGGSYAYGSKVTLPRAAAGDVLDPNVRFTLSVTDPDGKSCVAADGTEITGVAPGRFEIELSAKGAYRVVYEAADTFGGRTASVTFLITSADTKPPVLQFGAEWTTAAKINEKYVFPKIETTDDLGGATVYISVSAPTGKTQTLPAGADSLIFTTAGRYRITVLAIDESGNAASYTAYVTVSED